MFKVVGKGERAGFDHPSKAALLAELAKLAPGATVTFDALRATLGRSEAQLSDGALMQLALDAGYEIA